MLNNQIYFFIGTTAELIKLFPIMQEMNDRGIKYKFISSGQNRLDKDIKKYTNINTVDFTLFDGSIKQNSLGLLSWFVKTFFQSFSVLKKEFKSINKKNSFMIVHGDTISTVMGTIIAKINGLKIIHIEAGLRSFNYFKPFPEEIDRMIVSKFTDIHCCPNSWSMANIKNNNGIKINTIENTLLDSLNFALSLNISTPLIKKLEGEEFFIFVFHRQENLFDETLMKLIFNKIKNFSDSNIKCLLILHSPTKEALLKYKMWDEVENNKNIMITSRLNYFEFMNVLSLSKFIVTDGGSNQEESYYFGKPCLILRKETERKEGLGENVVLSLLKSNIIDDFLSNYEIYNKTKISLNVKPSKVIVNTIEGLIDEQK